MPENTSKRTELNVGKYKFSVETVNKDQKPDIEFQGKKGKQVLSYVIEKYEECVTRHVNKKSLWKKNREAVRRNHDRFWEDYYKDAVK